MGSSRRGALVATTLAVLLIAPPGATADPDDGRSDLTFDETVTELLATLREAAPSEISWELEEVEPADLGWRATRSDTAARVARAVAPSGAERALGLLPRRGSYFPDPPPEGSVPGSDGAPGLLAVGPDLVVVNAPTREVALTLEAIERARPLLNRATAPVRAWAEAEATGQEADPPPGLVGVLQVTRYPHYLAVDLSDPPGEPVDWDALWEAGEECVAVRHVAERGTVPAPSVHVRPEE